MKFIAVVNPVSGKGKGKAVADQLKQELERRQYVMEILFTTPDVSDFQKECRVIDEQTTVICVGGDGTLLYFLNAWSTYKAVAFYGVGTANVMALEFGIPRKISHFVDHLIRGKVLMIRPGQAQDGTRFLMMASFGIDGFIISNVTQRLKNRFGKFAFVLATIQALFSYSFPAIEISLDGGPFQKGAFLMLSRIKKYGGSFEAAPEADPESDELQVLLLHKCSVLAHLWLLCCLICNSLKPRKGLTLTKAKNVVIRAPKNMPCQLDGDLHEAEITQVEVSDAAFPLIV